MFEIKFKKNVRLQFVVCATRADARVALMIHTNRFVLFYFVEKQTFSLSSSFNYSKMKQIQSSQALLVISSSKLRSSS